MIKNKAFWAIAAVILSLYSNNLSFATEKNIQKPQGKYPDFSYEFIGKDSCEKFNRKLFVFNLKLNKYVLRPINIVWASVIPKYGMDRFQNAYNNMNYPIRLVGCLIQKDFKTSKQETLRFLTNTTIGCAGMYDPAQKLFKIESHQEDMGQALEHLKIKRGPYLVLPVINGNLRDLVGKLLDWPLRPTSYIGPFGAAANAVFAVNNTTYMQPMIKKVDDSFADPYEIAKEIYGIDRYIKYNNLDRSEVLSSKSTEENIININKTSDKTELKTEAIPNKIDLAADIELNNFKPQGSLIDSMRTAYFDNQEIDTALNTRIWSDLSIWNRNFNKKIKISSVNVIPNRVNYKYRYILQKKQNSPLAIIYPSFGEGITSDKSTVLAKILYDEGYSVIIQGSAFQWEFIKSMPENYKPGLPAQDAQYLRLTTAKIIDNIQSKNNCKFDKKILVGCSFGALTGLFTAIQEEQEEKQNKPNLEISKYIVICPPIRIFYALDQLDEYCKNWKDDSMDIKLRTAIAAEKIINVSKTISKKKTQEMPESMPFNENETKLIISFLMRQKLSDVIFAIEDCSRCEKNNFYETMDNISFYDYASKYVFIDNKKSHDDYNYESSLYSLANFLQENKKYKIYHTLDDYFTNTEQLKWLKQQCKDQAVYFSNGSHLGFLYRKEFIDEFKKDIHLDNQNVTKEL